MIFSSYIFLFVFLPVTFACYFGLLHFRQATAAKWFLVAASFFFYWYGSPDFIGFFVGTVVFNYIIGTLLGQLHASEKWHFLRTPVFIAGILGNVLFLGYFKYLDFIIANINFVSGMEIPLRHIVLPIGISFYTFQLIAYLVDSYRGETKEYEFINYLLFITFFPQLIVGPIVHHKDMVPQFESEVGHRLNYRNVALGLFLFSMGAVKKLLLADPLTKSAQSAFNHPQNMTMITSWLHAVSYTVSYYFDLSGYADMAIGLGKMFNVDIPINFNSPYKARNFADYWRRWHITLSKFLSDYIFRSVYKKGGGSPRFYFAVFVTFFVSGAWHGAGWNFIVWGILNGLFVMMAHFMTRHKYSLPSPLAWFLTFVGAVFMRVLFVSSSFRDAFTVFRTMFNIHKFDLVSALVSNRVQIIYCVIGFCICVFAPNSNLIKKKFKPNAFYLAVTLLFFTVSFLTMNKVGDFLYFQF